ncbi:hypothetical protein [Kytococcus sedentarius]|uniref:hypothetical protein n=1 Tax=Kytococcus sedentarius TaxID=1276 RepID=UPI0035BC73AF
MQSVMSWIVSIVLAVLVFTGLRFALIEWFNMDPDIARWVSLVLGLIILIPGRQALRNAFGGRGGDDRARREVR